MINSILLLRLTIKTQIKQGLIFIHIMAISTVRVVRYGYFAIKSQVSRISLNRVRNSSKFFHFRDENFQDDLHRKFTCVPSSNNQLSRLHAEEIHMWSFIYRPTLRITCKGNSHVILFLSPRLNH